MNRLLPLSTDAETAARWDAFTGRYLSRRSGGEGLLRSVIEADPDLAIAHAHAALMGMFDDADFDPGEELAAVRRGRADHDWERSYVECAITTHSQGMWPAWPVWRRHTQRFPADLLGLEITLFYAEFSTDPDAREDALSLVAASAQAVGEHPFLLGFEAMIAQDDGRLDDAYRLAGRSLELDPTGFDGGHPMAHVYFESGDHAAGADWLDGWLPSTDQDAPFGGHLVWHSALHHLAVGDGDAALERYRCCTTRCGPGALFDGTSLLWRCQMHDLVPRGQDPSPSPVAAMLPPLTDGVPFTFVGAHVALGLATAEDADGLRRFAAAATGFDAPGAAELLPGLARGLAAYVEGDHATASELLLAEELRFGRYGGSHAQREVFEDTLIQALVQAGRFEEATSRLKKRLDRRESRFDTELLRRVGQSCPRL